MSEKSRKRTKKAFKDLDPRVKFIVVPILVLVSIGAIVFVVMTLMNLPKPESAQRGIGANGFRAYEEKDGNLGAGKIVTKEAVVEALAARAKSVSDVKTSGVINLNGDRGQTATFDFTKANGKKASIYIDLTAFKSPQALEDARVYNKTGKTDPINGKPTYYMHAQTMGSDREYRLMLVDNTKVYKFVLVQPFRDITINEVSALATLKKIAAKAQLQ